MNLLPKTRAEFNEKDYWNKFFKKLGAKAFEWYGEYLQLCGLLHKYMKPKDVILVIGCGNSTLSADLYDVGYKAITNIDISEVVIRQMQQLHSVQRPEMKFLRMDLLEMSFPNETFSCVLDKGTLDALMTDSSPEVQDKIDKILKGISHVLRMGGRYICISLLQEHILQKILSWFEGEGWMVRICRCIEAERKENAEGIVFPVFVVICTKLTKMPNMKPILELSLLEGSTERLENKDKILESVQAVQQYAFIRHHLSRNNVTDDSISIDLYDSSTNSPRYSLFIIDGPKTSTNRFAIFIVPQGRETEYLFATHEGHRQLFDSVGAERLVVVHLQRDHTYQNLDTVKEELSGKVMELAPSGLGSNVQVPFLSVGEDVGQRRIRYCGNSEFSGKFVIEDVTGDEGQTYRRLIFLINKNTIQSEVKLKKGRSKSKSSQLEMTIDKNYLACQHHVSMVAGLGFLPPHALDRNTDMKILVIGLGGGSLCTYLHQHFDKVDIDVVEIDPAIVTIATDHFGFSPDQRMKVHVADGLEFINICCAEETRYDLIMCDIDNKDTTLGMSCPPRPFVKRKFLDIVKSCLNPEGIFVLNLVCRNTELKGEVMKDLRSIFPSLITHKVDEEVNEIIYCCKNKVNKCARTGLSEGLKTVNKLVKKKQATKQDLIDVTDMIQTLKVE